MTEYEKIARAELTLWKREMQKRPSPVNRLSKDLQERANNMLPERWHKAITSAIREMVKATIFGSKFTNVSPLEHASLEVRERRIKKRIEFYSRTAGAEGAATGFGGFWWGVADFPLWLSIKMKMIFEIASLYGYDVSDYRERVFLLYIFQLTFSSQRGRQDVYRIIDNWEQEKEKLPKSINDFEWRDFQQEYRDYIDLAKLLQLIPGLGAIVGGVVNHRLTRKLGNTAINCFRNRMLE